MVTSDRQVASTEDAALVARVRKGDERAFERLVRRHLRAAHAVARSLVSREEDADDVCQDAFIVALRKIHQLEDPERFRGWFLSIVRNRAHNVRSREKLRETEPLEEIQVGSNGTDPLRETFRGELRSAVREALVDLTELQRRVLVLHDLEGWKHREIAEELEISPGSSRVHLYVARRAMRRALGPRYAEAGS